jgi:hypothetical protein
MEATARRRFGSNLENNELFLVAGATQQRSRALDA